MDIKCGNLLKTVVAEDGKIGIQVNPLFLLVDITSSAKLGELSVDEAEFLEGVRSAYMRHLLADLKSSI